MGRLIAAKKFGEPFVLCVVLLCSVGLHLQFVVADDSVEVPETVLLLEGYPNYSVVLPINHDNPGEFEKSFVVQAPRFHRVMAVIQYLNLPPSKDFSCSGSFLQFQDGADEITDKICGNFDPEEKSYDPPSLIGSRSHRSTRQTLKLVFVHKNSKALTSYARISFTAFRDDCYFHEGKGGSGGQPRYRPCEYLTNEDGIGRQCIVSNLFCDEIINCAGLGKEGRDFGLDETALNCPHLFDVPEGSFSYEINSAKNTSISSLETNEDGNENEIISRESSGGVTRNYRTFFDEREEHLANLFKTAIIGFVGICTLCIITAFVLSMFCSRNNNS